MNIVILGAGTVGGTLAESLAKEDINITVVDHNKHRLNELREKLDIGTVYGHAAHPDILREAGCLDADMLIAVTSNDETNMIACQVAYTVFNTPKKIARIRSDSFSAHKELFADEAIPIDIIIVPEQLVADSVGQLIAYPGARQVVGFADGEVNIVVVKVNKKANLVNNSIANFDKLFSASRAKILAIYRNKNKIKLAASTVFEPDDEVILLCLSNIAPAVIENFQINVQPYRSIIIGGGGNIGYTLANHLEYKYNLKIIDPGQSRVNFLAEKLQNTLVLKGDAADKDLLIDENISETSLFCAVTNNDGINIMSALLAKRLGARKVISLVTKGTYSDLIAGSDIDAAISPQQVTVSALLRHIRKGDIVKAYTMREGSVEAIELVVHGDKESTNVVGRRVDALSLPRGSSIVAIIRAETVIIDITEEIIQENDRVIIFLLDKSLINKVEKLFQVAPTFL